jgi:hypothetical protein
MNKVAAPLLFHFADLCDGQSCSGLAPQNPALPNVVCNLPLMFFSNILERTGLRGVRAITGNYVKAELVSACQDADAPENGGLMVS